MTTCSREEIEDIVHKLPEDTSIEEAMERLYIAAKVKKGLEQVEAGQEVTHQEARERLKKWLE